MRRAPFAPIPVVAAAWILSGGALRADEPSISPHIDEIRQEMKEKGESATTQAPRDSGVVDPYIQSLKANAAVGKEPTESYTEELKKDLGQEPAAGGSYSDQVKSQIGPDTREGAIEALNAGRSELHEQRVGEVHSAAGFRVGLSLTPDITAASSLQPFNSIYGSNWPIDITAFYEYQPWHSEWFGNIGFFGQVEVGYYHGAGTYQYQVHNADTGGAVTGSSNTAFQFFTVPITLGVNYRFNLFRYFRPFAMAGVTGVGFYEDRNDGGPTHTADSRGLYFSGGVNILMDWVSKSASWDLYAEHGIQHYYLTVDYSHVQTVSGDVSFNVSGVYAGFTFEF